MHSGIYFCKVIVYDQNSSVTLRQNTLITSEKSFVETEKNILSIELHAATLKSKEFHEERVQQCA